VAVADRHWSAVRASACAEDSPAAAFTGTLKLPLPLIHNGAVDAQLTDSAETLG